VLEVGCGAGPSTLALAEQGADVVGLDEDASLVASAGELLKTVDVSARAYRANATEIRDVEPGAVFDQVIFWAVLEHMTIEERLVALRAAWDRLPKGGLLTVVETPNRLWPFDSHTSKLPFFSWLPPELAYRYSAHSPREGFRDRYLDDELTRLHHFLRRGHGVSFHEFDLAIGDHRALVVRSSLQSFLRRRDPVRFAGWHLSADGSVERVLRRFAPDSDRAWLQPFLYLGIERT
jgi:S-adenosylmethionine-dependent methyltransferase